MIRIASCEVRQLGRSGVASVLAVLVTSMLLVSAFIGWRLSDQLETQSARYQRMVEDAWAAQPDRHPHRVSHYGFLVFRGKSPLSFFDFGLDSFTGTTLFLEPHRQNTANFSEARHATGMLRFGEMSPALVLQLIVPLLIFFVAFSAIPREREHGTLALLRTGGVGLRELVLGKSIGILALVFLWTVPALAATVLFLSMSASWTWTPELWSRLCIMIVAYGAYLWICTLGAVLASAFHRTSRGSLASLVTLWVVLWIVVPRALPSLGETLHPAPSKTAFDAAVESELREIGDGHDPNDPHFKALEERTLREYGATDVDQLPVNYKGIVMLEAEKNTALAFRTHYRGLLDTYKRQNQPLRRGSWANPYLAVRELSMAVAGTDFDHYESFQWEAEDYRFQLVQRLNELHVEEVNYSEDVYVRPSDGPPTRQRISRERFADLPEFKAASPSLAASLAAHRSSLLALILWVGLLTVGACVLPVRVR